MTDTVRFRPRGRLGHGLGLLSPAAATAGRVGLERDAGLRLSRLENAVRDAALERFRPTRRTMRALAVGPGGRLAWRSVPAPPRPQAFGAVVRPVAVATCDLDRPLALGCHALPAAPAPGP